MLAVGGGGGRGGAWGQGQLLSKVVINEDIPGKGFAFLEWQPCHFPYGNQK